ncbi:MAG: Fic family protein [Phenylobacterium sp.]|jgi:Fic family protein
MAYNWQHPHWPNFTYDDTHCRQALYQYALLAGKLSGGMAQLTASLHDEAYLDLMVSEAVKTSEIEGEKLNREDVRSSIKNFLGLTAAGYIRVADPRAEGIAALMVDVRKTFAEPLCKDKLFQWQTMAIPGGGESLLRGKIALGQWRQSAEPMQIVSGAVAYEKVGYEKVHYEAVPANTIDQHIEQFLDWYNRPSLLPGPIRAAIAHLWFESIHPFEDGNGRVGRAIAEQALAQDLGHPPLMSLSTEIEKDRNAYYNNLNAASQDTMDITPWVIWFCQAVLQAQQDAVTKVDFILEKAQFWDRFGGQALNARQQKVINKWFSAGPDGSYFESSFGLSAKKYMAIAGCAKATATRDLTALVAIGCLYRLEGGGRNARYALTTARSHHSTGQ